MAATLGSRVSCKYRLAGHLLSSRQLCVIGCAVHISEENLSANIGKQTGFELTALVI